MKKILTVLLMLSFALIMSCDKDKDDDSDDPKNQTATRTLAHGVGTVTVQGYMTNAQWNGVPDKIAGRLNGRINADIDEYGEETILSALQPVFNKGVVYIVETNPVGYNICKTTGDGRTVYIALNEVDTQFDILSILVQGVASVDGIAVQ